MARALSKMKRAELEREARELGIQNPQLYNVPELREWCAIRRRMRAEQARG